MTDPAHEDPVATAKAVVDANDYLTVASADAGGTPWASPVWFAHDRYTTYLWVSRPGTRHSRNITDRPEVGAVVFDSTVAPGQGQAVYLEGVAGQAPDSELDRWMPVYAERLVRRGGTAWTPADVTGDAAFRLYVLRTAACYVLDEHDHRQPVDLT